MRGQRARDEEGFLLPLLCSGFKAVAARAGSGSHLQNEVEDAGWDGARESGGVSITEWTPRTSPGCRHGGCCCWSRCHSSGGWSSWPPPATSSACSSVDLLQCRWGAPACLLTPPEAGSSHRNPRPQAGAAGVGATRAAVGWRPMGRCPLPTWRGPPRGHAFRRAANRQKRVQTGSRPRLSLVAPVL